MKALSSIGLLIAAIVFSSHPSNTITVSRNGGADYSTITDAVNAAQSGDIIKIIDVETYPEQVTIDSSKSGLTLTSASPAALTKPKISYQDKMNVGPRTFAESLEENMITFQRNGALRILGASCVTIEGISIDGGGPYAFGYPSIWNGKDALQSGNAAIVMFRAGAVVIRNCDISNAYIGVFIIDRNIGGIYTQPVPADLDTHTYVPLSAFGRTGNHVIEGNRIHNNSWGMHVEALWDLGSTIRYNLFYENHHPSDAFAAEVKSLTALEGPYQAGGAMFFKDNQLCPLAIYNNTFWHNFLIFAAHWQAGYQHLVFNNIYGPSYRFWLSDLHFASIGSVMEMDQSLINRMYNCVYSSQQQAPGDSSVQIMNGLQAPGTGTGVIEKGAAVSPFPAGSTIRWLEIDSSLFLSIDPASSGFLEPKWSDTNVQKFILKHGWEKSGVKNTNGAWADLGAIQHDNGKCVDLITIRPTMPISFAGAVAAVQFTVDQRIGKIQNPTLANMLFRFVRTGYEKGSFGGNEKMLVIGATNQRDLAVPASPIKPGANSFTVTIPGTVGDFGFVEMIAEGAGSDGKTFSSAVGFLPYRKLDYKIVVEIWDTLMINKLESVKAGETVLLRLIPQKSTNELFTLRIMPVDVNLQSGFPLLASENPAVELSYPDGILGQDNKRVIFTRIPEGGVEFITAAGTWRSSSAVLAFLGGGGVRVISNSPEKLSIQGESSNSHIVNPVVSDTGSWFNARVSAYDRFNNKVTNPTEVVLENLSPGIVDIADADTIAVDGSGSCNFTAKLTSGARENDTISLLAGLINRPDFDTLRLIIGKPSTVAVNNPFMRLGAATRPGLRDVVATCYDLQGRTVLRKAFSGMTFPAIVRSISERTGGLTSKVYLMEMIAGDGASMKQMRTVQRIVVR